jgi:hypothetical protein
MKSAFAVDVTSELLEVVGSLPSYGLVLLLTNSCQWSAAEFHQPGKDNPHGESITISRRPCPV